IGIGLWSNNQQTNTAEYFLGQHRIPWWAIGFSIIATSFSAASLLGGPGEGFTHGLLYLQLQLGDLIGYGLVIAILLPFFMRLNLTTAYQYLEKRFDIKTRSLGSICFLLFVVARLGALLYAASLVVATITSLPLYSAILLVGTISIVYTAAGGMAAVIWTDVLQFLMIFVGLGAGVWAAVSGVEGGFSALWQVAIDHNKFAVLNPVWEPESIRSLPTALLAYGVLAFAIAGTNQQAVQRYVSCPDASSARKAILLGWFSGFIGVAATLFLGILIFGFYQLNPGLPQNIHPDDILSHFIVYHVPPGSAGLLIAAIFAAAMSSIDSALHSLATCITVDFYQRHIKPESSEHNALRVAQWLIIIWGIIGIGTAFYVAAIGKALLPFLIKYTTMFMSPLLGLFLMGVLLPKINATGAFYGTIGTAIILVISANFSWLRLPGIWHSAAAVPISIILGLIISLFDTKPSKQSVQGLTIWT
ncbi:sodium-coupled permease, partial [Achromatium sp. WMS3]